MLVTNTSDFVLLGEDTNGNPAKLETFRLAESAADFDKELQHPRAFANKAGLALAEYLGRALSHRSAAGGTPRSSPAAGFLRPRRPGPGRGGGRRAIAQCRSIGAGRSAGRPVRGRAGRSLLPLDPSITTRFHKKGALSTSSWLSAHTLDSFVGLHSAKRFLPRN